MNYLFFFVHPAKYYMFRNVINRLKNEGHSVDILIIKKSILEELICNEGWEYKNIFPHGRKLKRGGKIISLAVYFPLTILKLLRHSIGKKYDLFITDDLLTITGRILGIKSILCTDDDLTAVPESWILMAAADYILSTATADMEKYNHKKIAYNGVKAIAHLHPEVFKPDIEFITRAGLKAKAYCLIRCVSVTSTHDTGKKGIGDALLLKLVEYLKRKGQVVINSERILPQELREYLLPVENYEIAHYTSFAKIFISDSTTMCAEAAVLGTPAIEIDDWHNLFGQYGLLNGKYGLLWGFMPEDEINIFSKIDDLLNNQNLEEEYIIKKDRMINESDDLNSFIYNLLAGFPLSAGKYKKNHGLNQLAGEK